MEISKEIKVGEKQLKPHSRSTKDILDFIYDSLGLKRKHELASFLGVSEKTVNNWKNGKEVQPSNRTQLEVLDLVFSKMEEEFIPQSARMKILRDEIKTVSGDSTDLEKLIKDQPENPLILEIANQRIQKFVDTFLSDED